MVGGMLAQVEARGVQTENVEFMLNLAKFTLSQKSTTTGFKAGADHVECFAHRLDRKSVIRVVVRPIGQDGPIFHFSNGVVEAFAQTAEKQPVRFMRIPTADLFDVLG